jgi:hypothetical protein
MAARETLALTTGQAFLQCLVPSSVTVTPLSQSTGGNSDQKTTGHCVDGGYSKIITSEYGASARYFVGYEAAARITNFMQINRTFAETTDFIPLLRTRRFICK